MGRRPDRLDGASASCTRAAAVVVFVFVCVVGLLAVMVATSGVSAGVSDPTTTTSSARYSGGGAAGAGAFRGSKRRIPKGPDPIHNRRAGKTTTIAPRRRD